MKADERFRHLLAAADAAAWAPAAVRAMHTQVVTSSDAYYAQLGAMRKLDEPEPVGGGLCKPEHPRWRLVDGDPARTICGVCHPPAVAPERVLWVGAESLD